MYKPEDSKGKLAAFYRMAEIYERFKKRKGTVTQQELLKLIQTAKQDNLTDIQKESLQKQLNRDIADLNALIDPVQIIKRPKSKPPIYELVGEELSGLYIIEKLLNLQKQQFQFYYLYQKFPVLNQRVITDITETANIPVIVKLMEAVAGTNYITIDYQKFDSQIIKTHSNLKPIALREFQNSWYLLALRREDQIPAQALLFGVDRIKDVELLPEKFTYPPDYTAKETFDSLYGVGIVETQGFKPEPVVLGCTDKLLPYLKSKPIHNSQTIINENQIRLELIITYELIGKILSYQGDLWVITPEHLKIRIQEKAKKITEKHTFF
jgi:hypothetical protein